MLKILIISLIGIFKATCNLTSRESSPNSPNKLLTQKGVLVDTTDHIIDLNQFPDHVCINHHRQRDIPFSQGFKYSIKIKPKKLTDCFTLYNEFNCQGVRLQFHNVSKEKILKFDHYALDHDNQEELLNFDVKPSSISSCLAVSNHSNGRASGNSYSLRITNSGTLITDACSDIEKQEFYGVSFIAIFLDRLPTYLLNSASEYQNDEPYICLEIFSNVGCAGEMVHFIIAKPLTKKDIELLKSSIMLWHVYDPQIPNSIDTDFRSFRNCPDKSINQSQENAVLATTNNSKPVREVGDTTTKETAKYNPVESTPRATQTTTTETFREISESYSTDILSENNYTTGTTTTETLDETSASYATEIPAYKNIPEDVSQTLWKNTAITIGAIFSATIVFGIIHKGYKRRKSSESRLLTQQDIDEFEHGLLENDYGGSKDDGFVHEAAFRQPYNKTLEIPKGNLEILTNQLLGGGEYGRVFKALVTDESTHVKEVALKMSKPNRGSIAIKGFLSEIKILTYLGHHPNIVPIIGAYTAEMHKGTVYLATELCTLGSLRTCLENCQDDSKPLDISAVPMYDLIRWSYEISCGMEYLERKKVIHADLATRNVLLSSESIARISDFGLSRRMYEYTNYTKTSQEPLPWRWMAYESLKRLEFSTKSDVWSYGVTLWEIFSLASQPYPGISWYVDFVENLEEGLRLKKPRYSSADIYEIMKSCWNLNKRARPTFTELKNYMRGVQTSAMDYIYTTVAECPGAHGGTEVSKSNARK